MWLEYVIKSACVLVKYVVSFCVSMWLEITYILLCYKPPSIPNFSHSTPCFGTHCIALGAFGTWFLTDAEFSVCFFHLLLIHSLSDGWGARKMSPAPLYHKRLHFCSLNLSLHLWKRSVFDWMTPVACSSDSSRLFCWWKDSQLWVSKLSSRRSE